MPFNPNSLPFVQSRDSLNPNPAKVGEAVYSFMRQTPEHMEVGQLVAEMAPKYVEGLEEAANLGSKEFEPPFYIIVFTKKEPWSVHVVRNWYIRRQTRPSPKILRQDFPLHAHDVWMCDKSMGMLELQWTLPIAQDSKTILKHPDQHDPQLVDWIIQFNKGQLS